MGLVAVAVTALVGSIVGIVLAVPKLWGFLSRFVKTVDIIQTLGDKDDAKLEAIQQIKVDLAVADKEKLDAIAEVKHTIDTYVTRLSDHLIVAGDQAKLLHTLDRRTVSMLEVMADVRYEVKNNGGGSVKDSVDRIEAGVAGLYAHPGEATSPGRESPGAEHHEDE